MNDFSKKTYNWITKKLTEMDYYHGNMHELFPRKLLPVAQILLS